MLPRLFRILVAAPGSLSTMARPRAGDWLADEMTGLRRLGVDHVVSALTGPEIRELGLDGEAAAVAAAGMTYEPFPIPDRGVPGPESLRTVSEGLRERIDTGQHVAVHCRHGIGRASVIAAAVLLRYGIGHEEAFRLIGDARGVPVPDTDAQRELIAGLRRR